MATQLRERIGEGFHACVGGDDVIDHYHHAAQWEISETDRVVTDFERERLLERA